MKNIKILSWNINSIRIRLNLLQNIVDSHKPDIICLQETKVSDELFPVNEVKKLGFDYITYKGEKGYNGMAILSKFPFELLPTKEIYNKDARDLAIKIQDIQIHNLYVPAGGYEADLSQEKFLHKINYLKLLNKWTKQNINSVTDKAIFLGDINVAYLENDVWSHKQLLTEVSHTPIETSLMQSWIEENRLIDISRQFIGYEAKLYSWWSYRNKDYKKSNRGRRLDYILITENLRKNLVSSAYIPEIRDCPKTSDHVPIIMELAIL